MSYINYNNVTVKVNSQPFLAESISIDIGASLSSNYLIYRKSSFNFVAESVLKGTIQLSYPVTGKDYLADFISSETPFRVEIGGITINSGYLTSYGFSLEQFKPIKVNANIDFWEKVGGSFSPSKEVTSPSSFLTSNDVSLTYTGVETLDNIIGLSYSYSSSLDPEVFAGNTSPSDIKFLEKQTKLDLETYSIGNNLSYSGSLASFNIVFGGQSYGFNGVLESKSNSFGLGQKATTALSFKQDLLNSGPIISSVSTPHTFGSLVTIEGQNLSTVHAVLFHPNVKSPKIIIDSATRVRAELPMGSITGPATVVNLGGEVRSATSVVVSSVIIA